MPTKLLLPFTFIILLCSSLRSVAQAPDSTIIGVDSMEIRSLSYTTKLRELASTQEKSSLDAYRQGQKTALQRKIMVQIESAAQAASLAMQSGIDTAVLKAGIIKIGGYLNLVGAGIQIKKSIQTQRNLAVSSNILNEIYVNLLKANADLANYSDNLISLKTRLDSLSSQHVLYEYPTDSASLVKYFTQSSILRANVIPIHNSLRQQVNILPTLQSNLGILLVSTKLKIDNLEKYRSSNSSFSIARELPDIWEKDTVSLPFIDALKTSKSKVALSLRFYTRDNFNYIVFVLIVIAASSALIYSLKNQIIPNHISESSLKKVISLRHPFFTATFISINILQFIFSDTPFLFNAIMWSISMICISVIFFRHLTIYWMKFWVGTCLLFFASCLINLMLESSAMERYAMLLLSGIGTLFSLYIFKTAKRNELKLAAVYHFSTFTGICQIFAFILNIFGRYNLAKTLLSFGFMALVIGISLLWTVKIVKELIAMATYVYKDPHRKNYQVDYDKLDLKIDTYIYVIAALGWVVVVGRNFYAFAEYAEPFNTFLQKQRSIGSYSFSIEGIVVFMLIMACSLALSKLTSYFASEPQALQQGAKKSKMLEIGSWVLLIRIFIISAGIFLAFAAAGIPLDKLSIIIGALGVGIGLGLQGLVNNLVSGLIIAFEKPVNVGDTIELNQKMGTMRSIGFRSSVVSMADGASVVIPNGDLLGGQVINWTLGKGHKRQSILIGVSYGTDLEKVKNVLINTTRGDERILQNPEPMVLTKEFSASSIDFELLFWANIRDAGIVRSDLIRKIDRTFKAEGIEVPFPQQDVYLHNADKALAMPTQSKVISLDEDSEDGDHGKVKRRITLKKKATEITKSEKEEKQSSGLPKKRVLKLKPQNPATENDDSEKTTDS